MSPSATSAMPTAALTTASNGNQARHQSQPSAISATPATQKARRCRQVPHLARKVKVDVAKRHACHANSRGDNGIKREPSAPPESARDSPVPCLPPRMHVDVGKCHACHAECTSMSPSATPGTPTAAATTASNGNQTQSAAPATQTAVASTDPSATRASPEP